MWSEKSGNIIYLRPWRKMCGILPGEEVRRGQGAYRLCVEWPAVADWAIALDMWSEPYIGIWGRYIYIVRSGRFIELDAREESTCLA